MFFILDIMQVTSVIVPIVVLPTACFSTGYGDASKIEQCYKARAYSTPSVGI